ncbi:MFS transporter [Streptomyces sp. TRM S81-3]|uniref:MFS transporter n=1 Tax=Streptomyces griseicoloratus TaxID=2752516 RepID=A0A926QRB1_9ACTN|nr:MFS transporter [Streptomyces griseicoloratus]MBD0421689.1 MFS transporter [Streptomyces griseicoloratus]
MSTLQPVAPARSARSGGVSRDGPGFSVQLALLVAMAFAIPAQLYLAIPVAEQIQSSFRVDEATASWTGSAFTLTYAAGFLVFGPLSDRVGRRPVLALGALATAVVTALTALSPSMGWFITCRALQGLAAATFAPVALAYVADRAPEARRPASLSFITTGLLGAGLLGQAFGHFVVAHADWPTAFWPTAVVYAVAALALWRLLAPGTAASTTAWSSVFLGMARLIRSPGPAAVFASAITVFSSFVAMYAVLNPHLRDTFGVGQGGLLLVQAVGAVGLIVGPVVNRLFGGSGPRVLTVAGFVTAGAGLLLEQLSGALAAVVGGSLVFVAGISLVVPGLVGLLHQLAPQHRGAAVAFNTFVLFIGASLGQLAAAHAGYHMMLGVLAGSVILAAATVARFARPSRSLARPIDRAVAARSPSKQ